jgi:hypothetical protein
MTTLVSVTACPSSADTFTTCSSIAYTCTPGYEGADGSYTYSNWAKTNVYGYPHNCTMYIGWLFSINLPYHPEFNLLGDASQWDERASELSHLGVKVTVTPKKWRVAQWESNHVAFVAEYLTDPYGNPARITVLEDNLSGTTKTRQITPGTGWPNKFIDFGFDFSGGLPTSTGGAGSPGLVNMYRAPVTPQ